MKYKSIDCLDAAVEKAVSKHVKHYFSDWQHHDRPAYMKCKGSEDKADRTIVLIARECGTYLFSMRDYREYKFPVIATEYYFENEYTNSAYYAIDLDKLTLKKMNPGEIAETIATFKAYWKAQEKAA